MGNELNICISTVSFSKLTPKEELGSLAMKCIEIGIKDIELNEADAKNKDHVLQFFSDVKNSGWNVAVLTLGLNMLGGDVRSDEKYFNNVKNWIKVCGENGCGVLRLKASPSDGKTYSEKDFRLLYRNLLNILPSIEKNNVKVSIDLVETVYSNMDRLITIIEDIGSERIGITLDTSFTGKLEEHKMLERVIPLINHVSVKEDGLKNPGRSSLGKVFKAMKTVAYTGYVSLELPGVRNMEAISNSVNMLKNILSS